MVLIIGVAGASASGKTSVCNAIIHQLRDSRVVMISMDSFYRNLTPDEDPHTFNFDHPTAFDFDELRSVVSSLRSRQPAKVPKYDFTTNSRLTDDHEVIESADVVLIEGILTYYEPGLKDLFDMRIFVEEESDVCLVRRLRRDVTERGKEYLEVLHQYEANVKPMHDAFVLPQRKWADVIVPHGGKNHVAVDMLCRHFKSWMHEHAN